MRILRVIFALINAAGRGQIVLGIVGFNIIFGGLLRLFGDAQRVGSHVGDQTDRAVALELDALVQLLRDLHGATRLKAQLARSLLL